MTNQKTITEVVVEGRALSAKEVFQFQSLGTNLMGKLCNKNDFESYQSTQTPSNSQLHNSKHGRPKKLVGHYIIQKTQSRFM